MPVRDILLETPWASWSIFQTTTLKVSPPISFSMDGFSMLVWAQVTKGAALLESWTKNWMELESLRQQNSFIFHMTFWICAWTQSARVSSGLSTLQNFHGEVERGDKVSCWCCSLQNVTVYTWLWFWKCGGRIRRPRTEGRHSKSRLDARRWPAPLQKLRHEQESWDPASPGSVIFLTH